MTVEESLSLILDRLTAMETRIAAIQSHMDRIKQEHRIIDAKLRLLMGSWDPPDE
jgi:hypothetical protein